MNACTGRIFDIQRFSLHNGPGIRTTVFVKGCPLRCRWCSNPESQEPGPEIMWYPARCLRCGRCIKACPQGAITWNNGHGPHLARGSCDACGGCARVCPSGALRSVGEKLSVAEVLRTVLRDRPFYQASGGGLSVSGGEPMLQPVFTRTLLAAARQAGIPGVLETAGLCGADKLLSAARLCEMVIFDLKHFDAETHRSLTGAGNERICRNLGLLVTAGIPVRVRVPLVHELTATAANIRGIGAFLRDLGAAGRRAGQTAALWVELLPYHALGAGKYAALGRNYPMMGEAGAADCGPVSPERAKELRMLMEEISGLTCRVAGLAPKS